LPLEIITSALQQYLVWNVVIAKEVRAIQSPLFEYLIDVHNYLDQREV